MKKNLHRLHPGLHKLIPILLGISLILIPACHLQNPDDIFSQQSDKVKTGVQSIPDLLKEYEKIINDNPDDPLGYVLAATVYHRNESEDLFNKALKVSPDFVPAHIGFARYLTREERFEKSLIHFVKAITNSRRNISIKKEAIKAYIFADKYDEALSIAGDKKELKLEIVHVLLDQKNVMGAENILNDFGYYQDESEIGLAIRGRILYQQGLAKNDKNLTNEGLDLMVQSWEKNPECFFHYQYNYPRKSLIQLLTTAHRNEELKVVLDKGLEIFPRDYTLRVERWKLNFSNPLSDFNANRIRILQDIEILLTENPANPGLYQTAAMGYRMADSAGKMEEINQLLLTEFPYSMAAQSIRRTQAFKEENLKEKLLLQRQFVKDYPAWLYMYTNIFQTLVALDVSNEELLNGAEEFIQHIPNPHAILKIGDVFLARDIYIDQLEKWLERFIADSNVVSNSWDARLLTLKSRILLTKRQFNEAETILSQILDVNFQGFSNVDKAKVKLVLGHVLEADNRPKEALELYTQAFAQSQHYLEEAGKAYEKLYKQIHGNKIGMENYLVNFEKQYQSESEVGIGIERGTEINKPAPEFELINIQGKSVSLADLKGKVIILNFWATYCGPCIQELPHLQELYEKVKDDKTVCVLTISSDRNPALVEPFLRKNKFTFPVLYADANIRENYGVRGIPTTFIIDPSGEIKIRMVGFNSKEPLVPYLEEMIRKYR